MSRRRGDRIQGKREMRGVLVVPCLLNDICRCRFLVDTGAAFTCISRRSAAEMNLDVTPVRQMQIVSAHRLVEIAW